MKRIFSIDFTRGLVMIIMALDHVRDLIHTPSIVQSPTDLSTTTPVLFFTRWITYLCAPIFVFLAGTSAFLSFRSRQNPAASRRFLLKRGLWLVLLEFTLVNFGMFFDAGFHLLLFEVIATIGFGFIILSFFLKCSLRTIAVVGLAILFLHDLIIFIPLREGSIAMRFMSPLFSPAAFPLGSNHVFVMGYPPIPWLGIRLLGFAAGRFFERTPEYRKRIFPLLGTGAILLFVLLRLINIYGDPVPWGVQKSSMYSFLSFMNVSKYPPSLLFSLATLGIMFFMLWWGEYARNRFSNLAKTYGTVPLFYFIVHFYLIHLILIAILLLQGFHWGDFNFASGNFGRPKGSTSGLPLWAVYLIWVGVVAAMYKPCIWFSRYKATHRQWWVRYL
jgi:uncharacterized membrane protein